MRQDEGNVGASDIGLNSFRQRRVATTRPEANADLHVRRLVVVRPTDVRASRSESLRIGLAMVRSGAYEVASALSVESAPGVGEKIPFGWKLAFRR